jgi:hypothetical protein
MNCNTIFKIFQADILLIFYRYFVPGLPGALRGGPVRFDSVKILCLARAGAAVYTDIDRSDIS